MCQRAACQRLSRLITMSRVGPKWAVGRTAAIYLRRENVINKCEKPFGSCPRSGVLFLFCLILLYSVLFWVFVRKFYSAWITLIDLVSDCAQLYVLACMRVCACVWAFNYLKMVCQSVEEFDLKISESLPARPSLALKACDNAAGQSCCHKVFGGVACAPHASLSSPMTGVRMPIWAALIEFSKLYTRLCVYLSLSLSIYLYLRFLCLSRSALNFRLTACWAPWRKLSRCHCNTHLIRLVARLYWWFIVRLPPASAPHAAPAIVFVVSSAVAAGCVSCKSQASCFTPPPSPSSLSPPPPPPNN